MDLNDDYLRQVRDKLRDIAKRSDRRDQDTLLELAEELDPDNQKPKEVHL